MFQDGGIAVTAGELQEPASGVRDRKIYELLSTGESLLVVPCR
jgi:hypothetical protein